MLIEGRNRADREVPACFARDGTGWYRTLKVNETLSGSKGKDVTMAEHFPEPLKLQGVLPPILFP